MLDDTVDDEKWTKEAETRTAAAEAQDRLAEHAAANANLQALELGGHGLPDNVD